MRKLLFLSVLLTLAACQLVPSADTAEPARKAENMRVRWARPATGGAKVYHAKRMKDNTTIDANWDKAAWKGVKPLVIEYYMGDEPKHQPKAQAKVAYDADNVYVIWRVEDNYVRAKATRHLGPVWRDSCVEFFFTPGSEPKKDGYFNVEASCTGKIFFGIHVPGNRDSKFKPDEMKHVAVASSLRGPIDPEIARPTTWTLEYRVPMSMLEKYARIERPAPGVSWRANFYKCGDDTSHPHWLTWSPVRNPEPQFHLPQFFATLAFD